MSSWVIFSDLDESLLDHDRYSFEEARPALEEIRRRGIPLVYCTSKTAAESLHLQGLMGVADPFIVEGGGGVYVPRGYFAKLPGGAVDRGTHHLLPLSAEREEVLRGLGHLKEFTANSIRAFDDMTDEEVARETGLPLTLASLARRREFDEPFRFVRREGEFAPHLGRVARERHLRVTKGGRFYHVHGDTDKGRAARLLASLFRAKLGAIVTMGLGDSEMDLPLLAEVDVPIAIPRRDGRVDPALANLPRVRAAAAPGPRGWNDMVLETLSRG